MGNVIMRVFREELEQEEMQRGFFFILVLLYVVLFLIALPAWINARRANEIRYDRQHENHAE